MAAVSRPPWKLRRRIITATLAFCAGMVIWLVWKGEDTNLAQTIANACFFLAGSVIGAYVFGAAYDDKNVMQHLGKDAYPTEEPLP
jgi:predicted MFS family arabinose efflux permease